MAARSLLCVLGEPVVWVEGGIIAEFVLSLEGSDEFLCERVMDMTEQELQASSYSEEKMISKLAEFRYKISAPKKIKHSEDIVVHMWAEQNVAKMRGVQLNFVFR
ncbi:unnamed protein product [Timema podura]|uniref:Uncharacterized protein n=1 Tax=Timema podura TaxID=61482 RepID=A0ABN7NWC9_TIMPD|nr:unnamed protein product [Timema podura]